MIADTIKYAIEKQAAIRVFHGKTDEYCQVRELVSSGAWRQSTDTACTIWLDVQEYQQHQRGAPHA